MADTNLTCTNCHEAPQFDGCETCLECTVAIALVEQPDYLEFAKRTFAHEPVWIARLEREWNRQASAFEACAVAA